MLRLYLNQLKKFWPNNVPESTSDKQSEQKLIFAIYVRQSIAWPLRQWKKNKKMRQIITRSVITCNSIAFWRLDWHKAEVRSINDMMTLLSSLWCSDSIHSFSSCWHHHTTQKKKSSLVPWWPILVVCSLSSKPSSKWGISVQYKHLHILVHSCWSYSEIDFLLIAM